MHSAICSFDTREQARQAVDRLVQSGFARRDVHVQHRHVTAEGDNSRWDGMEREVAVDRGILANYGEFFASLFGRDHAAHHVDTYTQAVERGSFVVVADAPDAAQAQRARTLMEGAEGREGNVVDRGGHRSLRDILGLGDADPQDMARGGPGNDGMAGASIGGAPTLGARNDPDLVHAPGLRYADKDKPL